MVFFHRIIKAGWQGFYRNALVSSAAILILFVTLSLITGVLLFNVLTETVTSELKNKVSVGVYFLTNAPENDILQLRTRLLALSQVKEIEYVSRAEALKRFRDSHQNDETIGEALNQLGGQNPLPASLSIKASDTQQYTGIVDFIKKSQFTNIIDDIDFSRRQAAIENLGKLSRGISQVGIGAIVMMGIISFLVSFNTLRLAIYNDRQKIGVMRLVGASKNFVRGPFIVQGILYAALGSFASLLFWAISLGLFNGNIEQYFAGLGPIGLATYYSQHWLRFLTIQFLSGVFIGVVSSVFAIRRHLDV